MHEGEDVANLDESPVWVLCLGRHALSMLCNKGGRDRHNVQLPILPLTYLGAGDDNALIFWHLGDLGLMLLLQPERWKVMLDILAIPYNAVDYCIGR
jgi:hypothetical protein